LHAYDGHIHEGDPALRERMCNEAFAPVEALAAELRAGGLAVPRIVAGGTPTFRIHARRPGVECSPGTCVLNDVGYGGKFKDLDFKIAACVLTRVISKPAANLITTDLGHKAVAAENPQPRAEFPDLPDAKLVTHSEEHLVIETSAAARMSVGDVLYAFPKHICPTVALYNEAVTVTGGRAGERWPISARARRLRI
jgi:D-threonine aldolase